MNVRLRLLSVTTWVEGTFSTQLHTRALNLQIVRCGGQELHVTASIMGGIAAQESIKLLTTQMIPLQGYLLFNGISGSTTVIPT